MLDEDRLDEDRLDDERLLLDELLDRDELLEDEDRELLDDERLLLDDDELLEDELPRELLEELEELDELVPMGVGDAGAPPHAIRPVAAAAPVRRSRNSRRARFVSSVEPVPALVGCPLDFRSSPMIAPQIE